MSTHGRLRFIGLILCALGVIVPLVSIPSSSAFDGDDSLLWRVVRGIWTGEVVLREGRMSIEPDRDEALYEEFLNFSGAHPYMKSLSEEERIDVFYDARYRGLMPRMTFITKLTKKKVVTVQKKVAVSNRSLFFGGLFLIATGIGLRAVASKEKWRSGHR